VLDDLIDDVVPVDDAVAAYARLTGPGEQRPRGALMLSYPEPEAGPAVTTPVPEPLRRLAGEPPVVGFVGCGAFARQVLVPAFTQAGARLEVVGGGAGPSAEAAVRQLGFRRWAADEQAVLADSALDTVVIATRHGSHAALVEAALRAGKHVFCEKPLALTVAELEAVLRAAESAPGILAVGFNRRFAPLAVQLRQFLRQGGGPATVSYRVSAGEIPAGHWVHDLEQGGGRIAGEVCHFLDTLVFLTGSPLVEVHATGFNRIGAPVQAHDNVVVTARHADGSIGTVTYVSHAAPKVAKERIEAFAPGGIGVLDDYRSLALHTPARRVLKGAGQQKGHREEVAAFVAGTRSGRAPVPLTELANVSLATLGVVDALRTGAPVPVGSSTLPPSTKV
jgi:predicted dehydrogenase